MRFKIKVNEHGQIIEQHATGLAYPEHGHTEGDFTWVRNPTFVDMASKYWDFTHGIWRNRPLAPNNYSVWENGEWISNSGLMAAKQGAYMVQLRMARNLAITDTDWTQLPDAPIDEASKSAARVYRQALRDVPSNNVGALSEEDVVWPTKPSFL